MALPSSGEISSTLAYLERWGTTPSGSYTLEQLQDDWNLAETPDNTDIFAGKGRAVINVDNPSVNGNDITVSWDITHNTGFSGTGDIEFRFYTREAGTSTKDYHSGWFSRNWDSTDSGTYTYTNLDYDTEYNLGVDVQLVNWSGLTYDDEYFQAVSTEPAPPQNVSIAQSGSGAELSWDHPITGSTTYEWEIGTDSGTTTNTSVTSEVCGQEVPNGETGNVTGRVRADGSTGFSEWISDSTNIDCSIYCLVRGTEVSLLGGDSKQIQHLSEGDVILGADIDGLADTNRLDKLFGWRSEQLSEKQAVSTIAKIEEVTDQVVIDVNDGLIKATGSHTQLIKRRGEWRFLPLRMVQEGDVLRDEQGNEIDVDSVNKAEEKHTVYKLTLEQPFHTFYANGILTHNVK